MNKRTIIAIGFFLTAFLLTAIILPAHASDGVSCIVQHCPAAIHQG